MGKQPAGKLRQAFDMGKHSIRLTQTKLSLPDRQKSGLIYTCFSIKIGNGGGVIAGINANNTQFFSSIAGVSKLRA